MPSLLLIEKILLETSTNGNYIWRSEILSTNFILRRGSSLWKAESGSNQTSHNEKRYIKSWRIKILRSRQNYLNKSWPERTSSTAKILKKVRDSFSKALSSHFIRAQRFEKVLLLTGDTKQKSTCKLVS